MQLTISYPYTIGVIGGSKVSQDIYELAYTLGGLIWKAGFNLVCGGLSGVMEACCKGYVETRNSPHGIAIGIIPGEQKKQANPYLDIVIPTGMGIGRNLLVVRTAELIIVVDGCSGTLSEIAYGWQLEKPIISIKKSGGWAEKLAGAKIDNRRDDIIVGVDTPEEAVQYARKLLKSK